MRDRKKGAEVWSKNKRMIPRQSKRDYEGGKGRQRVAKGKRRRGRTAHGGRKKEEELPKGKTWW